jgi:hypothetical protein
MNFALSNASDSFDLVQWRETISDRRALARRVVLVAQLRGEDQLEVVLDEVKRAVDYHAMSHRDRDLVRTTFKDMRTIVRGWSRLSTSERDAFHDGETPFSTTAKIIRSRS